MTKRVEHKHPLAIRWFHWINFPLLTVMIWSGTLIYWANDIYRIGFGDTTLLRFYPQSIYDLLHIPHRLAEGMALHFAFMWLFAVNGILYVAYTVVTGEWKYLIPDRSSFREAVQVTLFDLRLSRKHPPPRKYNGAQQIAYSSIILMGVGSIVTGLAIYKPTQLSWLIYTLGGYQAARLEHFILTIGYILFFAVHLVQVMRAGWNNFRAMVTGVEVMHSTEEDHA